MDTSKSKRSRASKLRSVPTNSTIAVILSTNFKGLRPTGAKLIFYEVRTHRKFVHVLHANAPKKNYDTSPIFFYTLKLTYIHRENYLLMIIKG